MTIFVPKTLVYISIENVNACNEVGMKLIGVQSWSEITQSALHLVQLPCMIINLFNSRAGDFISKGTVRRFSGKVINVI